MKITDLLTPERISLNRVFADKDAAIDALISLHQKSGSLLDAAAYRNAILARESQGSTAVGDGVAIPHAKSSSVKVPALAAVTCPAGVDYDALDGKPSCLLFMIASPEDGDLHLEVLAELMKLLMDRSFRERLLSAKTPTDFLSKIDQAEMQTDTVSTCEPTSYRILAVTACPTGIAHTYMAAEALEQAGKRLGYALKAETNGSGGVKNVLTADEIAAADGIIIAADKSVEMARFDGKKLISVKVSDGIKKPDELIERIVHGDAPVYTHKGEHPTSSREGDGIGRQIYKYLMNGVSHMLPFVVAGGILIAVAFLIDTLAEAPRDANFGTYTPAAAFLKTVGGYAFSFMIPVLAAYIASSIADRPGLLVGFVGGYLATLGSTFAMVDGDISSGFLGALFAGFAGGCLMLGLRRLCNLLPEAFEGIKPVLLYPVFGLLLIAILMCAVNPFMGMINSSLADFLTAMSSTSKVLLGCILGAMMSVDMGGPFNKAAYVFGTAAIASGNYDIMAAVMIGGMVPPLAIALATTFFGNRFTKAERKSGPVNYIMGLSFITEGAIPYAASDPLRVIPSCAVGAAVAGGLSMLFGCTLMAPHGGIFVFAVVGNWAMYLLSLVIGSIIGMLLLAALKKKQVY